jgi:hypothetical protein
MRPLLSAALGISLVLGGCSSSAVRSTHEARHACDLITSDVIAAARFNHRVERRTKGNGAGKHGGSACTFGDDPDPTKLSANFLALLVLTPAGLKVQHATARREARAVASPCPATDVRELGSAGGMGSYAYFCVKNAHAPAGGWIEGDNVYLLEVGTPDVDYGTTETREAEFEAVARAIARNVNR